MCPSDFTRYLEWTSGRLFLHQLKMVNYQIAFCGKDVGGGMLCKDKVADQVGDARGHNTSTAKKPTSPGSIWRNTKTVREASSPVTELFSRCTQFCFRPLSRRPPAPPYKHKITNPSRNLPESPAISTLISQILSARKSRTS